MSAPGGSAKVIIVALLSNIGVALAKLIGAYFSGSASLLAEGIHTLVDCANQVLLLVGSKKAQRAPSKSHPLGYGREAFFWSFIVAILLFSLGGLFAIYEGIEHYSHPEPVTAPVLGLVVLLVCGLLEGYSCIACIVEVRKQNTFGSLWAWFRKTTSSDLLVVFTEQAAAMVGLILAGVSLTLCWITGNGQWDAVGSILVGGVLVIVSVLLAVEIKSLLIGEAPATNFRSFIEQTLAEKIPGAKLFNMIALQTGPEDVLISCKISAGSISDVGALIAAMNATERALKIQFPEVKWLFIEPDTED